MLLHWRENLADQNKQYHRKLICVSRTKRDLSVWNKPLIDTWQHCSTSQANQALRSLANTGFQNRGVCLQAFPSFPSPSPLFHFLALVSFLAQSKPKVPFLGISLLWNQTETLATQAIHKSWIHNKFIIFKNIPTSVLVLSLPMFATTLFCSNCLVLSKSHFPLYCMKEDNGVSIDSMSFLYMRSIFSTDQFLDVQPRPSLWLIHLKWKKQLRFLLKLKSLL